MYIALSELRFAKGRFALMGAVIALITVLVVLLSGLTAGLASESVSALRALPGTHVAFEQPATGQSASYVGSRVTAAQVQTWAKTPGVASASALGVAPLSMVTGDQRTAVTTFGVDPDGVLAPHEGPGATLGDSGSVVLSAKAAKETGVAVGERVELGEHLLLVTGIASATSFDHTPVVWVSLRDWRAITAAPSDGAHEAASVVVLDLQDGVDIGAVDQATGTMTQPINDTFTAVGSFSAENGSLNLMRLLLFAISALVVGAFFTVWSVQRSHDLAVLKAIGASSGYLLKDALGQAFVVLALGGIAGTAIAAGAGAFAARTVPFVVEPATTLFPLLVMVVVGMAGAAIAVRQVTSVDPLLALGASR